MDHKGLGVAHEKHRQKPASLFPDDNWLSKTKPKQAFGLTRNAFNKLLWSFK